MPDFDTLDEFKKKARKVHGSRYDYNQVKYKRSNVPVTIVCRKHGRFDQKPSHHLQGTGCPKCGYEKRAQSRKRHGAESFVDKARKVHSDRYDYSRCIYRGSHIKIEIGCAYHGAFWQTPTNHLSGWGCLKCAAAKRAQAKSLTQAEFLRRAKQVHGNRYDYSKTKYTKLQDSVEITCQKHGVFTQQAGYHLSGCGCQKCGEYFKPKSYKCRIQRRNFVVDSTYEEDALRWLIYSRGIKASDILVKHDSGYPTFKYHNPLVKSKTSTYYPDFVVSSLKRVIEVKSTASFGLTATSRYGDPKSLFRQTAAKAKSVLDSGYCFTMYLLDDDGERLHLPDNWFNLSYVEIKAWYNSIRRAR